MAILAYIVNMNPHGSSFISSFQFWCRILRILEQDLLFRLRVQIIRSHHRTSWDRCIMSLWLCDLCSSQGMTWSHRGYIWIYCILYTWNGMKYCIHVSWRHAVAWAAESNMNTKITQMYDDICCYLSYTYTVATCCNDPRPLGHQLSTRCLSCSVQNHDPLSR